MRSSNEHDLFRPPKNRETGSKTGYTDVNKRTMFKEIQHIKSVLATRQQLRACPTALSALGQRSTSVNSDHYSGPLEPDFIICLVSPLK